MIEKINQTFKAGYVAIVGCPNVGKSTLLNHLLNFKVSAVTRKKQTTRHQIRGILNGPNYQVIFFDTPGLLTPKNQLHRAMLQAAYRSLKDADLLLYMVEAARVADPKDVQLLKEIAQINSTILLVINKVDKVNRTDVLPLMDFYKDFAGIKNILPVSALKRDGLDILTREILNNLPEGLPFYSQDQVVDHPERFIASEIIREKIFQRYGEEIPYATTVEIEEFNEHAGKKDFIKAVIYVEKSSQKGILIGKKGESLKKLGQAAREAMETILGRSVFLELWVKVMEKWRQNEELLKKFGYFS
ncbi:MAG: GTPase Era [bacterium]